MAQLPPLHPISTTREVPNFSLSEHAVPSPTIECESPRRIDAIETALSEMSAALDSLAALPDAFALLGTTLRRPNDSTSRDAVPQQLPILIQTSLLMPAVPVDNAVANAADQRLAQPLPLVTSAATNPLPPPPSARPEWDPDDHDLLLKSTNRPWFTESFGVRIRAFLEDAENFLDICGRPRDRWARFIISWLGANEAEKVRRSHFFSDDVNYTAFRNGLITLF